MNPSASTAASPSLMRPVARCVRRARARLAAGVRSLRLRRQRNRQARQFAQLDERMLRDLGVCRSEFDSCWAEAAEAAEATRRRIALLALAGAAR